MDKQERKGIYGAILIVLLISISAIIGFIIGKIPSYQIPQFSMENTSFIYDGDTINLNEQKQIRNVIQSINPIYLKNVKSIFFTKNQNNLSRDDIQGQNINGEIIIKVPEDKDGKLWCFGLRVALCHEILHALISSEEVIGDINNKWLPCYVHLFNVPENPDCSLELNLEVTHNSSQA